MRDIDHVIDKRAVHPVFQPLVDLAARAAGTGPAAAHRPAAARRPDAIRDRSLLRWLAPAPGPKPARTAVLTSGGSATPTPHAPWPDA
jgi:hypothetical protein